MVEWLSVVDVIYEEAVVVIALGTGATVIAYFRGILNRQKENRDAIEALQKQTKESNDKTCKRIWRLERAFSLSLKLTAKLTRLAHADEPEIIKEVEEIEELVNMVLKDDPEE